MTRSFIRLLIGLPALSLALGACLADDDVVVEEAAAEQAVIANPFVLRSALVSNQVVDTLFPTSGAFVRMSPANVTTQQRWRYENKQLRYNTVPSLCLQPESMVAGARLILRPCEDVIANPSSLQVWGIGLKSGGRVILYNELSSHYMDAGNGAFGILRAAQQRNNQPVQEFTMSPS